MEKEGFVSLWIGNSKSDDELQKYLELSYTDDGDAIPSQFLKDFNISRDDFDDDFVERVYLDEESNSITELIEGCSYDDVILPKYKEVIGVNSEIRFNSGILLYNFNYYGDIKCIDNGDQQLQFISAVKYTK